MILHRNAKCWKHPVKIQGKQLLVSLVIPLAFQFSLLNVAQAESDGDWQPPVHCTILAGKPINQYKGAPDTGQIEVGYILRKTDGSEEVNLPDNKTKADMVSELERWHVVADMNGLETYESEINAVYRGLTSQTVPEDTKYYFAFWKTENYQLQSTGELLVDPKSHVLQNLVKFPGLGDTTSVYEIFKKITLEKELPIFKATYLQWYTNNFCDYRWTRILGINRITDCRFDKVMPNPKKYPPARQCKL